MPVILDPAVYGGHREIDLAMLALFGGLPDALVRAYEEVAPLAAGWRERIRCTSSIRSRRTRACSAAVMARRSHAGLATYLR